MGFADRAGLLLALAVDPVAPVGGTLAGKANLLLLQLC